MLGDKTLQNVPAKNNSCSLAYYSEDGSVGWANWTPLHVHGPL